MNIGTQTVAQVQPVQVVYCGICGGPHFSMHCVATAKQVEEINFLKQNNPYSNTYNPGWKDQQGNVQNQGPIQYQKQPRQYQQQQQYPPKQQQYQQQAPKKTDWELTIERMAAQNYQFQEEI